MQCLGNKGMDLIGFSFIMLKYNKEKCSLYFGKQRVARKREEKEETERSGHLFGTWYLAGIGEGHSVSSTH